jgi:uncharacterized membrane protein YbhN (UPF0104 family)
MHKFIKAAKSLMGKKYARPLIAAVLLVTVFAYFGYYVATHQYLLGKLASTPPAVIVGLVALYGCFFLTLMGIFAASYRMCRVRLGLGEDALLNGYTVLANFFIPGQSGPFIRGAYLKRKRRVPFKNYLFSVLVHYACLALLSAVMLFAASGSAILGLIAVIAVAGVSALVIKHFRKKRRLDAKYLDVSLKNTGLMLLATALQAVVQIAIYYVELRTVSPHVGLLQAISYTGAANFAIFVALTPGAIGIREAFLFFSSRLHHIAGGTIIAASVIDRGVFLIYLGLLLIMVLSFHARNRLNIKAAEQELSERKT